MNAPGGRGATTGGDKEAWADAITRVEGFLERHLESSQRNRDLMSDPDDLPLAAEFPAATHAQWRKLVDGVLKGAPFETLQSSSADGLTIEPLYPRAPDASPMAGRAAGRAGR